MSNQEVITFRIKDKGGTAGGKTISYSVPEFNWEEFKHTPNAQAFVKKAYYASVKKIMREVEQKTNGSTISDLQSLEAVVTRSLAFTKAEIKEWLDLRDWSQAKEIKNVEKSKASMAKHLPQLAARINPFNEKTAEHVANAFIADVADKPVDSVADYLFSVLTLPRNVESDDDWIF